MWKLCAVVLAAFLGSIWATDVDPSDFSTVDFSLEQQNGTLCLNKTRANMKKTEHVEFKHNCISASWGTVDNTGRLMPMQLWQESSMELDDLQKLKVSKIQQWETIGTGDRQCLCLRSPDLDYLCMKMYLPDDLYWHGTVFLAHSIAGVYETCTKFEFIGGQICIPAEETEDGISYCICAVKGQNNEDSGQLQLCEKNDPTSFSSSRWNLHLDEPEAYAEGIEGEHAYDCDQHSRVHGGEKAGCKQPVPLEWCNWKELQGVCALKPKFAIVTETNGIIEDIPEAFIDEDLEIELPDPDSLAVRDDSAGADRR